MPEVFSADWARALAARLNASDAYRRAAARWEGDLVLALPAHGEATAAVYLDLHRGLCREACPARESHLRKARFVLRADAAAWQELLWSQASPLTAVSTGKVRLERGRLVSLVPHLGAATELLRSAAGIATEFPSREEGRRAVIAEPDASPGVSEVAAPDRTFVSTSAKGLDFDSPALRLWAKAKRDGVWDPAGIDFSGDRRDWLQLRDRERQLLLHLGALFGAGEESVVIDLLPLIQVIASEGRLEEEIYLTSFLWEEAKHVEAFRRFFDEVAAERSDLSRFHSPSYRRIFHQELPTAMDRLRTDTSPVAQAEASTTYNLIVEGMLAETGYHFYYEVLSKNRLLPAMQKVVALLKADESRHLAYGVFLLTRLVAEHGDPVWQVIERRLERLLEPALGVIREVFDEYAPDVPFGLELEPFLEFATRQFESRRRRVEVARRQTLAEVLGGDAVANV